VERFVVRDIRIVLARAGSRGYTITIEEKTGTSVRICLWFGEKKSTRTKSLLIIANRKRLPKVEKSEKGRVSMTGKNERTDFEGGIGRDGLMPIDIR